MGCVHLAGPRVPAQADKLVLFALAPYRNRTLSTGGRTFRKQ